MAAKNDPATEQPDGEFVVTREFDAPRDLVYQAWTQADRGSTLDQFKAYLANG